MTFDGLQPFSSLLSKVVDNRGRTCPTAPAGIPLIATNCIRNDLLYPAYEKVRFVDEKTYKTWFRGHPEPGDLLFVTKGTPGRVCMVPDPVDFCIAQDMVAIRADEQKVYPRFLFAPLRSNAVQEQIEQLHVGTLIPHFKKGDFDKLLLPIPRRKTQEFIGDAYFDFSAKIELNRRLNETLEAMARAIFKSWFVDFDPVRAKTEGRQPWGMDAETAALFPDSFQDSSVGKVKELVAVSREGLNPGQYPQEVFDHYSIPAYDEGRLPKIEKGELIKSNKFLVPSNAVLLSKLNPHFPRVWFPNVGSERRSVCSTEFLVTLPQGRATREFLYGFLTSDSFLAEFRTLVTGTSSSHQRVRAEFLLDMDALIPGEAIVARFSELCCPLLRRLAENIKESCTLAAIRDALLPKLISGEIRVKDAEKTVSEQSCCAEVEFHS